MQALYNQNLVQGQMSILRRFQNLEIYNYQDDLSTMNDSSDEISISEENLSQEKKMKLALLDFSFDISSILRQIVKSDKKLTPSKLKYHIEKLKAFNQKFAQIIHNTKSMGIQSIINDYKQTITKQLSLYEQQIMKQNNLNNGQDELIHFITSIQISKQKNKEEMASLSWSPIEQANASQQNSISTSQFGFEGSTKESVDN